MSRTVPANRTTRRLVLSALSAAVVVCGLAGPVARAESPALVDDSTPAYYNKGIGTILDGTGPQFPRGNFKDGDPTAPKLEEPNLTAAAVALGSWLGPQAPGGGWWTGPEPIPTTWDVNTETAIVYVIDGGRRGIKNVTARFGVDNGIFVWVNGQYVFGAMSPGSTGPGEYEYTVPLGDLPPGLTYVQVLREDHGGSTGYTVSIGAP